MTTVQNDKHENTEREPQAKPEQELSELSEADLTRVTGGLGATQGLLSDTTAPTPPRDSVSGNATGRRAHKPI